MVWNVEVGRTYLRNTLTIDSCEEVDQLATMYVDKQRQGPGCKKETVNDAHQKRERGRNIEKLLKD